MQCMPQKWPQQGVRLTMNGSATSACRLAAARRCDHDKLVTVDRRGLRSSTHLRRSHLAVFM